MTSRTRYFVICSLLVLTVGVGTGLVAYYVGFPLGAAESKGPDELRYVPKDAALLAYADVSAVMASELRQRIRRAVPGQENGQQEFQNLTGINIETDIQHVVAFATAGAQGVSPKGGAVLARGVFNEEKIQALIREHGGHAEQYKGKWLMIAPGHPPADQSAGAPIVPQNAQPDQFALSFLQPGLVVLGSTDMLHRVIDLEGGGETVTTNDDIMNQVRTLDSGTAWAAGRFDALTATAKLPPALGSLPPITFFSATAQVNDGFSTVVRAEASSEEAAKNLREIVQGFIALAKLQGGSKPELQALVQSLDLGGSGKTVALSFSVPGQVFDLIAPGTLPPVRKPAAH
jgi:hypothetical protein